MATIEHPETALSALEAVQDRVLWLASSIIHEANRVRKTPSGVKAGGHQASSASVVSIMTALWFEYLRPQDRVSVKPHASPGHVRDDRDQTGDQPSAGGDPRGWGRSGRSLPAWKARSLIAGR